MNRIPGLPLGYFARYAGMKITGQPMYPRAMIERVQNLLGGQNGWMDVYGMMSLNKLRFFTKELKEKLLPVSPYEDLGLTPAMHRWHPFNRQMYLGARIMLPGHLLSAKGDRVALHNSVEARYPFLDDDVTDYIATLHPRWKLRGVLRDKFVERKVAERWLPKDVAWRAKKMFRAPMDAWIGGTAGSWVDEVLSPESLKKTGYFDPDAVAVARVKLGTLRRGLGRTGLEMGLTAVTATQLWHHLWISGDLSSLKSLSYRTMPDEPTRLSA